MSSSEKCLNCDGMPLRTGECDSLTCTTVFSFSQIVPRGGTMDDSFTPVLMGFGFDKKTSGLEYCPDFVCSRCGFACINDWHYCPRCGQNIEPRLGD